MNNFDKDLNENSKDDNENHLDQDLKERSNDHSSEETEEIPKKSEFDTQIGISSKSDISEEELLVRQLRDFHRNQIEASLYVAGKPLTIEDYERISEALCRAENILGRLMSKLWGLKKKLKKPPNERRSWRITGGIINHMNNLELFACSKVRNIFLGMKSNEKLVFGHTHHPFLFEDTGNTGSWVKEEYEHNTFIKIDKGKMELNKWDGDIISLN